MSVFRCTGLCAPQERLRWKWPPQNQESIKNTPSFLASTSVKGDTTVARDLLSFLGTHLLADGQDNEADQRPRGYSVEVHRPALGGTSALLEALLCMAAA